jgi:crossover junction endodeoxyribonuclease RuvC
MIQVLLSLSASPQADAADALAIAMCHANTRNTLSRMTGVKGMRKGRYR